MLPNERPIGLALIVCDTVIQDKTTNKRTLVGLFDRLAAPHIPFVHQRLAVYVSLTSGRGDYACTIRCQHRDTKDTVFSIAGQVQMANPLQEVQLVFNVGGPRFTHPGIYWVEFLVDDVPIMMRRLHVSLRDDIPPIPPHDSPDPQTESDN